MPEPNQAPAFVSSRPTIPHATVDLVDALGGYSSGAYLGHGLILTSWQNVAGERYLWNVPTEAAPSLRYQLPRYLGNGRPDEWAITASLCPTKTGWVATQEPEATGQTCYPYNLAEGMRVISRDGQHEIEVQRLLYADRKTDIALLVVDETIETLFPNLEPAHLDARSLVPQQNLSFPMADSTVEVSIADYRPQPTIQPKHGGFDSSSQVTSVIRLQQSPEAQTPIGTPYYTEQGGIAGLVWATSQLGGDSISPTMAWYQSLWKANETLKNMALHAVLTQALLPPAVAGLPTVGDSFSPELGNSGYDVLHYHLDLMIDPAAIYIEGIATLTIKATYQHLSSLYLDLRGMEVQAVIVDGVPVTYKALKRKLGIQLPQPANYGDIFEVAISYRGNPTSTDTPYGVYFTVGLEHSENPARLSFANQPDGANTWFPCNDHPIDRATYSFDLTVPPDYVAVANGVPVGEVTDPTTQLTRYSWSMDAPTATSLVVVAVADYGLVESTTSRGILIRNYMYRGTEEKVSSVLSSTDLAFTYLEDLFGPYPFETYGHVVTPMANGAIETQTMVTMPRSIVQADSEEAMYTLVVHELAHHWFGNTVTLQSWQDIWLNEGFATYAEWLALELRYGNERPLRQRTIQERAINAARRTTPLAFPTPRDMFGTDSYVKGAWVLHMLRLQLGDELFFDMLKAWVAAYPLEPVDTLDFFRFVEQFANRDLTRFRRQWLEKVGIPSYNLLWTQTPEGINLRACNLREVSYEFDVPIVISGTQENDTMTLNFHVMDDATQTIELAYGPSALVIDPEQHVLGQLSAQYTENTPSCLLMLR